MTGELREPLADPRHQRHRVRQYGRADDVPGGKKLGDESRRLKKMSAEVLIRTGIMKDDSGCPTNGFTRLAELFRASPVK